MTSTLHPAAARSHAKYNSISNGSHDVPELMIARFGTCICSGGSFRSAFRMRRALWRDVVVTCVRYFHSLAMELRRRGIFRNLLTLVAISAEDFPSPVIYLLKLFRPTPRKAPRFSIRNPSSGGLPLLAGHAGVSVPGSGRGRLPEWHRAGRVGGLRWHLAR